MKRKRPAVSATGLTTCSEKENEMAEAMLEAATKVCKKCQTQKSVDEFRLRKERPNNQRSTKCNDCHNVSQRARYERVKKRRANRVVKSDGEKYCWRCKETKHVSKFYVARAEADGRRKHCIQCCRELTQIANKNRPEVYAAIRRKNNLKRSFGMTVDDYEQLLKSQNGDCAICGRTNEEEVASSGRRMSVDHCHTTGRIRGILCSNCNIAIGKFKDDPDRMTKAIQYLINTRSQKENPNAT